MTTNESVSIQPIDKITVNKICSGQVILSLSTAVKELIENSIDAGASSIQIKLKDYGSSVIEVSDNGCGVEEVNFQGLTLKHHTSKITEFSDLYSVETFGFRGEALSSLCTLSNVTIITQHKNANIGATLIFNHNGVITSNVKTLRRVGTTVRLENLFNTLPIRRTEFLKNLKKEFSKMCNILYAYGLQSAGVRITCTNSVSKTKFSTKETQEQSTKNSRTTTVIMDTKGESVETNIISIFGVKQRQNLLKITEIFPSEETLGEFGLLNKKLDSNKFKLEGYISSCAHGSGRTSSDRQFFFINSRPVDNNKISKLVNDIYHQYNKHQDPFVVLNIKVTSGYFDMNLTPDKRQILIENETFLLAILKESLQGTFRNIPATLEVQNLGLNRSIATETKLVGSSIKFCDAKTKNSLAKNNNDNDMKARIENLLKYRVQSKNLSKSTYATSYNLERFINFDHKDSFTKDIAEVPHNKNTTRNIPETTEKTLAGMNEAKPVTGVSQSSASTVNESVIFDKDFVGDVHLESIIDKERSNDNKRKLVQTLNNENITEVDKEGTIETKRIRIDEGLGEEDRKKRKYVFRNITLADVRNIRATYESSIKEKKSKKCTKFLAEIKPQSNVRAEDELKREIKKNNFKEMDIIGQFNLGFIITKLASDIFIIDQHASDEKYNFETLQLNTVMQTQKLFNPEQLELTADKEELMVQHKDVFKQNGFDFIYDENERPSRRIRLKAIPYSKNILFGKEEVDELLFLLGNAPELKKIRPSRVESMFASRACRKAVMIGTSLNVQEMRKIVDHMGEIEQPWNCPHGRPTIRHLVNLDMIHLQN